MEGHSSLRTLQRLEIEKCTPSSTNLVTNVKSRILAISFFPYYRCQAVLFTAVDYSYIYGTQSKMKADLEKFLTKTYLTSCRIQLASSIFVACFSHVFSNPQLIAESLKMNQIFSRQISIFFHCTALTKHHIGRTDDFCFAYSLLKN